MSGCFQADISASSNDEKQYYQGVLLPAVLCRRKEAMQHHIIVQKPHLYFELTRHKYWCIKSSQWTLVTMRFESVTLDDDDC